MLPPSPRSPTPQRRAESQNLPTVALSVLVHHRQEVPTVARRYSMTSRAFCQQFFQWYNEEHRHSGIGMLTPAVVHFGEASAVLAHRQVVLDAAYLAHPDRFVRQPPKPLPLPSEVWINKPAPAGQKTKLEAARAYMRGIERRNKAGLNPVVHSVASIFISRWDKAVAGTEPDGLKNRLGIAIAMQAYKAYRDLLISPQWLRLAAQGASAQRLLWASTGTKDPNASDIFYIGGLAELYAVAV